MPTSCFIPAFLCVTLAAQAQPESPSVRFDAPLLEGTWASYEISTLVRRDARSPIFPQGGQEQKFEQQMEITVTVAEWGATGGTVELVFDRLAMTSLMMGTEAAYDSADDTATGEGGLLFQRACAPSIGQTFVLELDRDRFITDVRPPAGTKPVGDMMLASAYENILGADRIREYVQPLYRPEGAPDLLSAESEWIVDRSERTSMGLIHFTADYTLGTIDAAGLAQIGFEGSVRLDTSGMGSEVTIEDDTFEGGIVWDNTLGVAETARTRLNVEFTAKQGPLTMEGEIQQSTTIERTATGEVEAAPEPIER